MKVSSAKLAGNPDASGWAQVHEFGDNFFVAVSLSGEHATAQKGKEIILELESALSRQSQVFDTQSLKSLAEDIVKSFDENQISLVLIKLTGDNLYIVGTGDVLVFLKRNGIDTKLLRPQEVKVSAVSGKILEGDLLVSATNFVPDLKLESIDPSDIIESLAPDIYARDLQGNISLAVLKFEPGYSESLQPFVSEKVPHKSVLGKFKGGFFNRFPRHSYIKRKELAYEDVRKRKTAVTAGLTLLGLLVISIIFGIRQKSVKNSQAILQEKIERVEHNLEEAKALFVLNPGRARDLFLESTELITNLTEKYPENQKVKGLKSILDSGRQSVLGEFDSNLEEFVDLSLIDGFEAHRMSAHAGKMYVFDGNKRRIASVEIGTKKTEVVVGPSELNSNSDITSYAGRVFVAESDGVFEVGRGRTKVVEKEWTGEALIKVYAGNLYVLDKSQSGIWRYPAIKEGFGSKTNWLAPGINVDLTQIPSWAIDGSVWILTNSGKIEKYSFGSPQDTRDFVVVPALLGPTHIYTDEELASIYVLDPAGERVVVFDKEGVYKAQYKSGLLKDAIGLAASEKDGKIIVLTKEKLFSIRID